MSKEIVPVALKIHKRVLKDKTIKDKDKREWVAMAEKAEFRVDERMIPTQQIQVNIGQLQQVIKQELTRDN